LVFVVVGEIAQTVVGEIAVAVILVSGVGGDSDVDGVGGMPSKLSAAMAVYEVKNGKLVAANVASPYRCAVFVAFTVTFVAVDVVVPMTVNLPPLVLAVNSLSELTVKFAIKVLFVLYMRFPAGSNT
jgi:hypothetical protein